MKTMLLIQAVLSVALLCDAATNNHPEGVQFSADDTRIVTTSSNNTVRLWDARTGKPLGTLPEQILRNKAIIHRYFEEWANRADAAVADELIATNLVLRNPPAVIRSLHNGSTPALLRISRDCSVKSVRRVFFHQRQIGHAERPLLIAHITGITLS